MDISEIKKLIKHSTAVLVLDNGEPSFVIMGYKTYTDIASERGEEKEIKINHAEGKGSFNGYNVHEKESEILERLNKEILALKNQIEMEEKGITSIQGRDIDPERSLARARGTSPEDLG